MIRPLAALGVALLGLACSPAAPPVVEEPVPTAPGLRQAINLRTAEVVRQPLVRHLRTIGQVEVGEGQVSIVNLRFSGWVEQVHVDQTGDQVRRGQPLFSVYSPELVSAQEDFLRALRTEGPDSYRARDARRRLELWGIATSDLDRLERDGEVRRALPVRSPAAGYVLHKSVVEGSRVQSGQDLYRIGNLDRIWVTADVYEADAPWVAVGQDATLELSFQRGQLLEGAVSYLDPTLDEQGRTLRVRLEFENPGVSLRPGTFATVTIAHQSLEDVLAVPSEAVLEVDGREMVLVDTGGGDLEVRGITTGLVGDGQRTEVVEGLAEGDRVVRSGHLLLSDPRALRAAFPPAPPPVEDE